MEDDLVTWVSPTSLWKHLRTEPGLCYQQLKTKPKLHKTPLLLHCCKALSLICLWHKSLLRSSFARVNVHVACKSPRTPSLDNFIHQQLILVFSYLLKADILISPLPPETPSMKNQLKISSKGLNYHIRDSPPRMNKRKGILIPWVMQTDQTIIEKNTFPSLVKNIVSYECVYSELQMF